MANPYDNDIIDSKGRMLCRPHRREVCHICCCDHRMGNAMALGEEDHETINDIMDRVQEAEHRAMAQQHAAEGGRGPVILGSEESERLYDAVATNPGQQRCAQCGTRSDKLLMCARCKDAKYCSKKCQSEHFPVHKRPCKAAARAKMQQDGIVAQPSKDTAPVPKEKLTSWRELEALQGNIAESKILELRILSQPIPFFRHSFEGKDHRNDVHTVAFYSSRVPPGMALGKVMRWKDPHFHFFMNGSKGARIEDEDLDNITIH
ncbi:hypothetical protein Ndes2526B_g07115 [Nannochloris sp. 'desiccata']|nr:hypothetical protein KSW81_004833 [Chlorella desiccata (nom. nud.)]KAH7618197.1 putative Histone-lysine N-methyltransferase SMYD3 [Chlorella desiccata (nom. nud.)]